MQCPQGPENFAEPQELMPQSFMSHHVHAGMNLGPSGGVAISSAPEITIQSYGLF